MFSFLILYVSSIEIEKASTVSFIVEGKGQSTITMPDNLLTAALLKSKTNVLINIYSTNSKVPILKAFDGNAIILKQNAIIENMKEEDLNITLWTLSSDICGHNNMYIYSPSYIKSTLALLKSEEPICIFGGFSSNIKISLDLSSFGGNAKATLYRSSDLALLSNPFDCEGVCEFRSKQPFVMSIYSKSKDKGQAIIRYQGDSPKTLNNSCTINQIPLLSNDKIIESTDSFEYIINKCRSFVIFNEDSIFSQVFIVVIVFVIFIISIVCLLTSGMIKLPEQAKAEEKEGLIKRSV